MEKSSKQVKSDEEVNYYKLTSNEEPIQIKNDYLLKSELTSRLLSLSFFIGLLYILIQIQIPRAISENDMLDLRMYQAGVLTVIFGIIWVFVGGRKLMLGLIKNNLYINIFNDKIDYEYITTDGEKKIYTIFQKDIKKVSWSWFPIFGELNKVVYKKETINDKLELILGFLPKMIFNLLFVISFHLLKVFFIEKYYLIEDKENIFAIKKSNNICFFSNKNNFSLLSLTSSLIIKNSKILKGLENAK